MFYNKINIHVRLLVVVVLLTVSLTVMGYPARDALDVVVLGDSNTWIGGDDCSKDIGWTKWFAAKFKPQSLRSYARSGATWCNTASTQRDTKAYSEVIEDQNTVYNQAVRLIESVKGGVQASPEVIIIGAGTNDAWFGKRRPDRFSETADQVYASTDQPYYTRKAAECRSLAASIRLVCEMLAHEFPEAQIVLLTPPQIKQCSYDEQRRVDELIEECGRRMSISVIRLDAGCGTYAVSEAIQPVNTSDGAHNAIAGARRTGNFVASQLESILLF